ncbi:MAG: serine/threonine-protein kinase [Gemmatimonadota bacterium]
MSTLPTNLTDALIAGRYQLQSALGRGSFGHTFLARDRHTDRNVAIKLLDPRSMADWKDAERFEREAAVLKSLRHHGIPEVHELIKDQWQGAEAAFLVMEYVDGTSLAQLIDEHRQLDPADVINSCLELLSILEYLHSRVPPVLHRDIKPANIIVRANGLPALVDFGSVRRVFMGPDEFGSTVAGTYGYMPYEQYMGQATPASDLYALGATLLHLVTGRPPREFMTDQGRIQVPETLPGDSRLRPVIAQMLKPSPAERFQSARAARQALITAPSVAVAARRTRASVLNESHAALKEPGPRPIKGKTKELLDNVSPGMLELMDGSAKPGDVPGLFDGLSLAFFSVLTAGVLPIVFFSMARARRRRLKRFIREGSPVTADIISIEKDKLPFDSAIARVTYQFDADGDLHRDADTVLPMIAARWQPGDRIQVLYLPELDYDSVIISTS